MIYIVVTPYNRFKATFYLVFEFCEHDLAGLLSNANVKFSLGEIKKVTIFARPLYGRILGCEHAVEWFVFHSQQLQDITSRHESG